MQPDEIRRLRLKLDLSQVQAARVFGVDQRTWNRWELGDRAMPYAAGVLLQLAVAIPAVRRQLAPWLA